MAKPRGCLVTPTPDKIRPNSQRILLRIGAQTNTRAANANTNPATPIPLLFEVAEFIHVSQSTYARIESGVSNSWAGYILPLCELFGIQPEELLKSDHIVINNNNTSCQYSGGYVINQISDKLIEQYEKRLAEKDSLIDYLQKEIQQLKTENKGQ